MLSDADAWNGRAELVRLAVSTPEWLPDAVARALRDAAVIMVVESSDAWIAHVKRYAAKKGPESGVRIRLIGAPALKTAVAAAG